MEQLVMSKRRRKGRKRKKDPPPYKILIPGQQHPYPLRSLKDPRLGLAQREMDAFYRRCNLQDNKTKSRSTKSNKIETSDESEDDVEDENIKTVVDYTGFRWSIKSHHIEDKTWLHSKKKSYKLDVKNEAMHLKQQDCRCAQQAIKFYNEQHDTDYEIVETLGSYDTVYIGLWYHCNFRAQSKSDTHSSPRLFFAEICYSRGIVHVCKIVDGPDAPKTVTGCKICGSYLVHPVNGFKVGS